MFKKLSLTIFKKEFSYLVGSAIMFTALFFLLFVLYIAKEIFIYYSDSDSMLLPKSVLVVDTNLSETYETLKQHNIPLDTVLLARIKNIPDLSVYSHINQQNTLAKDFTLISFDIRADEKIQVSCQGRVQELKLLDISLKHHKNWIFKTQKLKNCERKSEVTLITKESNIKMQLKRNRRYGELLYRSTAETDKILYPYLIALQERLFLKYIPYSKYFTDAKHNYTKETKEHSKMLNSLFSIIFAHTKRRIMVNHLAYTHFTDYKKIPFSISATLNADEEKDYTVVDELPIDIRNTKKDFNAHLIVANLSSIADAKYDETVIFCKKPLPLSSIFKRATLIERKDFLSVQKSAAASINQIIYVVTFLLFLLMFALINSFTSRNYALYQNILATLLFYGFRFKITTAVLFVLFSLSVFISYILSYFLLSEVNAIFNLYYVDMVHFEFEYRYLVLFFILSLVAAYAIEQHNQKKLINKATGR